MQSDITKNLIIYKFMLVMKCLDNILQKLQLM